MHQEEAEYRIQQAVHKVCRRHGLIVELGWRDTGVTVSTWRGARQRLRSALASALQSVSIGILIASVIQLVFMEGPPGWQLVVGAGMAAMSAAITYLTPAPPTWDELMQEAKRELKGVVALWADESGRWNYSVNAETGHVVSDCDQT